MALIDLKREILVAMILFHFYAQTGEETCIEREEDASMHPFFFNSCSSLLCMDWASMKSQSKRERENHACETCKMRIFVRNK